MTADASRFDARAIDVAFVERLISAQFPHWAGLTIRAAEPQGNDNRTFRLGEVLSVRLPSAERYAMQIEKEQAWLPKLVPHLSLPIPAPVAQGAPGEAYPFAWSINRWLEGEAARTSRIVDRVQFAVDVAAFLGALRGVDSAGAPRPGPHCLWRGGPLSAYDGEAREAVLALGGTIDGKAAMEVWEAARASTWRDAGVWFHGDVVANNLLVGADGRLSAVIDFGCSGVGDPACDLTLAWTFLDGEARDAFRDAVALDAATWARARGWALWKALVLCSGNRWHPEQKRSPHVIDAVIAEHRRT